MFTILGALPIEVKPGLLLKKENKKQLHSKATNNAKFCFLFMVQFSKLFFQNASGKLHFVC
jgi:hypothetical protein